MAQTITERMLDWVQAENDEGRYPRYTDMNNKYQRMSGSNSMSHHLPNWCNKLTERPCGRYLIKIESFPSKHVGNYTVKHREVNPYIAKLNKLIHVLTCAVDDDTHLSVTNNIQSKLDSVIYEIDCCKNNNDYKPNKHCLLAFNDYYRSHLPTRLK